MNGGRIGGGEEGEMGGKKMSESERRLYPNLLSPSTLLRSIVPETRTL